MIMANSYNNISKESNNILVGDINCLIGNIDIVKKDDVSLSQYEPNEVKEDAFELHTPNISLFKYFCVDDYINVISDDDLYGVYKARRN